MKWLNALLAAFWLVWTAVILPLHTPGIVPMEPGGAASAAGTRVALCPLCIARVEGKPSQKPARSPASGCALCDIKVKLYTGPVLCLDLRPTGLLENLPPARPISSEQESVFFHFRSRAPPVIQSA